MSAEFSRRPSCDVPSDASLAFASMGPTRYRLRRIEQPLVAVDLYEYRPPLTSRMQDVASSRPHWALRSREWSYTALRARLL